MKWFATNEDIKLLSDKIEVLVGILLKGAEEQKKQQETISVLSSRLGFVVTSLERTQKKFEEAAQEIDEIKQKGDFGFYYDFPINTIGMTEVVEEDKKAGRPTKTFRGGD